MGESRRATSVNDPAESRAEHGHPHTHEPVQIVEVVSAILVRGGGVLLQQRREDQDFPMTWECPGGKVEEGEDHGQALAREVRSELDLVVFHVETEPVWTGIFEGPVTRPDRRRVRVSFYRVVEVVGEVIPREGQGWGWFTREGAIALENARVLSPANLRAAGAILRSAWPETDR